MSHALVTADREELLFPTTDHLINYICDLTERGVDLDGYTATEGVQEPANYRFVGGRLLHIPGSQ